MNMIDLASAPAVGIEADRSSRALDADAAADRAKGPPVRFGITVGKRNARRAVERSLIKRVLRESARNAATELDAAAGARWVDIVLRLKAPCPPAATLPRPQLKRALRSEADALLAQLTAALRRDAGGVSA
jgi:RNase P protein component